MRTAATAPLFGSLSTHLTTTASAPPKSTLRIVADEVFATLTGILPNAIRWLVSKEITSYCLEETVNNTAHVTKRAFLNLHGLLKINEPSSSKPLLFLHGDHSHPYSLLHLMERAQREHLGPIFSLYLPYDDSNPTIHRALLTQAIDKIQRLMIDGKLGFQGLTVVGHSKGVIESAYLALAQKEERIKSLIAWAGRLKVTESCEEELKESINKIHEALVQNPHFPLFIISAGQDWCCREPESTQVSPHKEMYIAEQASHLNVLFDTEALEHYATFLHQAQSQVA